MAPLKHTRICKNPDCAHPEFIPRRSDQEFCDTTCKNHFHNKKRNEKNEIYQDEAIIRKNCIILKKLYNDNRYLNSVLDIILRHEGIDLNCHSRDGINESSGNKVIWFHQYGLELTQSMPHKIYKIHKR